MEERIGFANSHSKTEWTSLKKIYLRRISLRENSPVDFSYRC